jgi:hypothetical protein
MRTLLIVVTASALVLGLWTWISWSLAIAVLFLARSAGIATLVFLVQGAVQGRGRLQHFCRGAAIGMGLALLQENVGGTHVVWALAVALFYAFVGGVAGVGAQMWWAKR